MCLKMYDIIMLWSFLLYRRREAYIYIVFGCGRVASAFVTTP